MARTKKVYGKHSRKYSGKHAPKRTNGVYYTTRNPFELKPFKDWARIIKLKELEVLEPFAGENHIIAWLENKCKSHKSFDIKPKSDDIEQQDTLKDFPQDFKVCITNPPWLTNYSAKRHGLKFPKIKYDNIYKGALELALNNCDYVGFIIPGTFLTWVLRTSWFTKRLYSVIFINSKLFTETDNPVCLALFTKEEVKDTMVYNDETPLGTLKKLKSHMPPSVKPGRKIVFNSDEGNLGLICIDNTKEESIRFCPSSEIKRKNEKSGAIEARKMKISDRLLTKIKVDKKITEREIEILNTELKKVRKNTRDVFFAPFKGLRKDGKYRRRVDFIFVRNLINSCFPSTTN